MSETDAIQGGAGRELDALVAEQVMGERMPAYTHGVGGLNAQLGGRAQFSPKECWIEVFQYDDGDVGRWIPKRYSTDIAAAWEVHRVMCDRLFSTRQRYYRALQEAVAQRMGSFVMAWPDVISFLEPVDFCRAALAACATPKSAVQP